VSLNDFFRSSAYVMGLNLDEPELKNFFSADYQGYERYIYNPNNEKVLYKDLE
jgi:hypothetical protein